MSARAAVRLDRSRLGGYASMVVAAATWGSLPVVVDRAAAPAAVLVWLRMSFGAAALAVVTVPTYGRAAFDGRHLRNAGALGVLLAVHWVLFFQALRLLHGATPVLINYVTPLAVAVLAPLVLREARERGVMAAAVVGFAGLVLILAPEARGGRLAGAGFALASTAGFVALLLAGRHLAQRVPGPVIALWQNVAGALLVSPLAVASVGEGGIPWRWGVVMGVVHTAVTGVLYFAALARVPAPQAAVLMYMEPVSAVLFSWAFLDAVPGTGALAGGVLVIGAGVAIVRIGTRAPAPSG